MSVIRRNNWLGQERVDVPDMRSLDSGIAHDFDVLVGKMMANREPVVVRGLTIDTTNSFGNPPTSLSLHMAGSLVMHYGATEAGTMLEVPDSQADDQLFSGNSKVIGSFASNATNYVGIDYIRTADDTTADQTKFLAVNTQQEIARTVPKGVVLDYRITITTSPFSLTPNVCPVAIVVTDSSGNVSTITDARNLWTRLGTGGDVPEPTTGFSWGEGRRENSGTYAPPTTSANPFQGGDKQLLSSRDWMRAIMHVLWESKSGEHWYSPTTRDGVKFCMGQDSVFGNGDNWLFTSSTGSTSWTGLYMLFENSLGGFRNDIADGTATVLDGQCMYVDLDRTTVSPVALNVVVADLQDVDTPNTPGSRFIIAWRSGDDLMIRDRPWNVERLQNVLGASIKRYPNVFVSANAGEGDTTSLATAVTLLPAYGGVLIIMSDLTINSSVTIPANVKVLARRGTTLTLSGTGTELILGNRVSVEDLTVTSTKTSGVLVRATGFRDAVRGCKIAVNSAGTATALRIDGNACSVFTCEFTGVVSPSTGIGIATASGAQDYYIAGDNVFSS